MPIRFRCAYCNQLMAIATRKAGSVVPCPACAGKVIVPQPLGGAGGKPPPGGFDRLDFDQKLQGPLADARIDVVPIKLPAGSGDGPLAAPASRGLFVSAGWVTVLCVLVLALLGLAFFAGFMAAKWQ